jgi:hypothetical protein
MVERKLELTRLLSVGARQDAASIRRHLDTLYADIAEINTELTARREKREADRAERDARNAERRSRAAEP